MATIYICQTHVFNAPKGVFEAVLCTNTAQNTYMSLDSDETVAQAISRIEGQSSSGGSSVTFDSFLERKGTKLDKSKSSKEVAETVRDKATNKILATRVTTKTPNRGRKIEIKFYNNDGSVSRAVIVIVTRNADGSVTVVTE